jgi:DNA-binding response OmpR family regulator
MVMEKQILILTNDTDKFADMVKAPSAESKCHIRWANTISAARFAASETRVDLMIIDESVAGKSGFEIAREIIALNALINLALVSSLSDEQFHEAGEGLGIMARLSPAPSKTEAEKLIADLNGLSALKPPD